MRRIATVALAVRSAFSREDGFTLIETLIVVTIISIMSGVFAEAMNIGVNRSAQIQSQNILQTEVRYAFNQLVIDLRDASYGDTSNPVVEYTNSAITFYSPDRQTPWQHMRKIRYWFDGKSLKEQVVISSNTDCPTAVCPGNTPGPPWTRNGTDLQTITMPTATDPVNTLVTSMLAPQSGDPNNGGWASAQIFKYCRQSPPDMSVDLSNATSPELITWSCAAPTSTAPVKTVVARAVVQAVSRSEQFNYGTVATLRMNGS